MGEYVDDPPHNGVQWRLNDLDRRMKQIESLKPDVMAFEVKETRDDVKALKRAFYTFAFSVVGSTIVFAFTVFALLGK